MNFFEYQESARKNTKLLLLLFIGAVLSLIILTYLLFLVVGQVSAGSQNLVNDTFLKFDPMVFLSISGIVIALVTLGSLFRVFSLSRGGGASIAESMDGELLVDGGGDFKRRRLLNVVEEMAIASGTPVPTVYVIDEEGINAFAAGYNVNDAVIGITQGAIEHLSREELQGVIAHEFSHILNGDMTINLRLVGLLYGILMLSLIGRIVLRSSRGGNSKNGAPILAVGLGLIVIGYAGVFFGNLIKAAVSRQREFLADASAVQFTRNPTGIAGALKRIGGYEPGASIENPKAEEIGHALFASSIRKSLFALTATHPPLVDRIKRIQPGWDGEFQFQDHEDEASLDESVKGFAGGTSAGVDRAIDQIGEVTSENIQLARSLIEQLPEQLKKAAHEPFGARAVIYLLLLDNSADIRKQQLTHLNVSADTAVFNELLRLVNLKVDLSPQSRLPLMEMSIPALRQLSDGQFEAFKSNIDVLIKADKNMEIFEWSLQKILRNVLDESRKHHRIRAKYGSFSRLTEQCSVILSMLVHCDNKPVETHDQLIKMAGEKLSSEGLRLYDKSELNLQKLDKAIEDLRRLKPLLKPRLLKACAAVIMADDQISPSEGELMRAISDSLDCPMSPLTL